MNKPLILGGRTIPDAADRVHRYAGLPWSGGPPEVWAFDYYDAVPTEHDSVVTPVDVLCAGALHPGLSRADLDFFVRHGDEVTGWLDCLPPDGKWFWGLDAGGLEHLQALADFEPGVSLSLLTKVLHRKRPRLIPLLDRHVVEWYRRPGDPRRISAAWPLVIRRAHEDLLRDVETVIYLTGIGSRIRPVNDYAGISVLRVIDIAIWMEGR